MKKLGLIFTIIFFFAIGVFFWKYFLDIPPQFFPLNNAQGEYIITKQCPIQGWDETPVQNREIYCVNYKGDNVVLNDQHGSKNFFSVTVGKTALDLQSFEDKPAIITNGRFVSASMQCVQNVCKSIDEPLVVLDVDEVKLIK